MDSRHRDGQTQTDRYTDRESWSNDKMEQLALADPKAEKGVGVGAWRAR